jgi:hypothetical protein
MNCALLKTQLKKNSKLIIGVAALVIFYLIVMIFTADLMKGDIMKDLVESMMRSMGESEDAIAEALLEFEDMDPLNFVANGFFSLYFQMFLMVMYIMLVSRLIVKPTDTTAMSCYLSLPLSRRKYVATTAVTLKISVLLCGLLAYLFGILVFIIRNADINYWNYLNLVTVTTLLAWAVASVSMACGFIFAGTKWKQLSILAPIVLFVFYMFCGMAQWLNWLKYLSIFGWADYSALANGTFGLWWLVDLGCLAVVATSTYLSLYIFKKRNLSI